MQTILTSETFVVFEAGERRLAVNAMHVHSTVAGSGWTGETPLLLGTSPHLGHETPTRVLELETSDDQLVPVLTVGGVHLQTVDASRISEITGADVTGFSDELRDFVIGIVHDDLGIVFVLAPDALKRANDQRKKF